LPRLTVDIDKTVVLFDNTVGRRQAKASTFAHFLGGEKWLKQVIHSFCVHAAAVVADRQHYIFAGSEAGVHSAVGFVKSYVVSLNGYLAGIGNGIPGIDKKVGENLVELGRIHVDRPQALAWHPGKIYVLSDEPPQHCKHPIHAFVQVYCLGRNGLLPGKGQKLPGNINRTLGRLANFYKVVKEWMRFIQLVLCKLRMPKNHPKHIVEIMRHAACEAPNRLDFLCLQQLLLQLNVGFL